MGTCLHPHGFDMTVFGLLSNHSSSTRDFRRGFVQGSSMSELTRVLKVGGRRRDCYRPRRTCMPFTFCVLWCAGVTSSGASRKNHDRAHQRPVLESPCWSAIALLTTNAHSFNHARQPDGWADAVINFYFADDPSRHICELQVHCMHTGSVSSNDTSVVFLVRARSWCTKTS